MFGVVAGLLRGYLQLEWPIRKLRNVDRGNLRLSVGAIRIELDPSRNQGEKHRSSHVLSINHLRCLADEHLERFRRLVDQKEAMGERILLNCRQCIFKGPLHVGGGFVEFAVLASSIKSDAGLLQIGETELMLIALCGESFDWYSNP